MEIFTEGISNCLLSKEWLTKVDSAKSVPYLFKFCVTEDSKTCILITDTKAVWTEVLTDKQVLRRWRECNPNIVLRPVDGKEPIPGVLNVISQAHTIGAVFDASFDIVDSPEADLAFDLEFDAGLKWRWNTYLLGPRSAADMLSKHLIMPLISLAHVSFYSADPVNELEETDLEKLVDKIGRSARRSSDIHVRQTLGRPRIATTIQRVSSLYAFAPTLATIKSDIDSPDIEEQLAALRATSEPLPSSSQPSSSRPGALVPGHSDQDVSMREPSPQTRGQAASEGSIRQQTFLQKTPAVRPQEAAVVPPGGDEDSATESDDDEPEALPPPKTTASTIQSSAARSASPASLRAIPSPSPTANAPDARTTSRATPNSDSDSEPPPKKKQKGKAAKVARASDSDSESESDPGSGSRRAKSQPRPSRAPAGRGNGSNITRGVRQPLKRGAKRF